MGYFEQNESYLSVAFTALRKTGGILHFHDVASKKAVPDFSLKKLISCSKKAHREIELLSWHIIKSYAPGVVHVVLDVKVC